MWAVVMSLVSVIIGLIAGLMASASGADMPSEILTGFGAAVTTLVALVALAHFTSGHR